VPPYTSKQDGKGRSRLLFSFRQRKETEIERGAGSLSPLSVSAVRRGLEGGAVPEVLQQVLVTPQRPADPGEGIAIESQTVAPAVVPLNGTFLVSLLLPTLPGETGIQLRKIWFGQLLFQVLKGEKEHGTISLGREHVRGR
jgi:hypothetical protein